MTSVHQPQLQYPSLNPDQRQLLLNALSSNKRNKTANNQFNGDSPHPTDDRLANPMEDGAIDPSVLDSFSPPNLNGSSMPLFSDDPATFDFDFPEEGIDSIRGSNNVNDQTDYFSTEHGEKRKSPDDDDDDSDSDEKSHEDGGKVAKKPGRKPLTSEPTTKRKAQNRAAQRAFRERKEKHLKDLEQKVDDLEKASDAANHENGLLRAQVSRLQNEVKEYRKKLSTGSTASPPRNTYPSWQQQRTTSSGSLNSIDFSFDYAKFGSLPGTQLPLSGGINGTANPSYAANMSSSPGSTAFSRHASRSLSPGSNNNTAATTPSLTNDLSSQGFRSRSYGSEGLDNMFNADFLNGSNGGFSNYTNNMSMNNANKIMSRQSQSTTGSATSNAASPSASSMSHPGRSSSCATSPEPINQNSPDPTKVLEQANPTSTNGFDFASLQTISGGKSPGYNLDWLTDQNTNFDPVLFGEYRESQDAVVGGGDFSGGFFEDTFNLSDFNDPFNFNLSTDTTVPAPPPPKQSLMEHVEEQKNSECGQYPPVGPGDEKKQLMTAHKIWNTLQNCPKFAAGDFDIDGLCSELQTKAKCSESGVVVPKEDVEDAIWRLANEPENERRKKLFFKKAEKASLT